MGLARFVPVALFSLGLILVAVGVATGTVRLYLVLVFPIVAGSSGWLAGGIACLFLAFLTLPLIWSEEGAAATTSPQSSSPAPESGRTGGVVLLGPIPIFFGGWRHPSGRLYWLAVAAGTALFAGLLVALLFFVV